MDYSLFELRSRFRFSRWRGITAVAFIALLSSGSACSNDGHSSNDGVGGSMGNGGTASVTGGFVSIDASDAVGGSWNPAGTTATSSGGTLSASSAAGASSTGCTGGYELQLPNVGLCVAKMVAVSGPVSDAGLSDYSIDITEVTQGQYDAWRATNPDAPPDTDKNCGWNTSYSEQAPGYTGIDAKDHPVVNVDWCDAYAYCEAVGKRLCGAIGGGSADYATGYADADVSQWERACTGGDLKVYPYGDTYEANVCNGIDRSSLRQTTTVGSLSDCVTAAPGTSGVLDLSGNVAEWEDSCQSTGRLAYCRLRGGSYYNGEAGLTCDSAAYDNRNGASLNVGFRCCSLPL